jgi:hypothetical protein
MKTLIAITAAILMFSTANAQPRYRQHTQASACAAHHKKITPRERAAIARERRDVHIAKKVAAADGIITPRERRIIRHEQAQVRRTAMYARNNNHRRY